MFFRETQTPARMWELAAIVHGTLGNESAAELLYRKAIQADPNAAVALNNLGYMLLERGGDIDEAARLIERSAAVDPENVAALDSIGMLRIQQGRIEDDERGPGALTLLRQAARLSDQVDPTVLLHLGDAEAAAGLERAARRTWRHGLALLDHPQFRATHLRQLNLIQRDHWGLNVVPSEDLYDLEFGHVAALLRDRLAEPSSVD